MAVVGNVVFLYIVISNRINIFGILNIMRKLLDISDFDIFRGRNKRYIKIHDKDSYW